MSTLTTKRPGAQKLVTLFLRSAALAVVLIASLTDVLLDPSTHASLADRVIDHSEAVIAGARVAAISTDTNSHYHGNTNRGDIFDDGAR